MAGRLRTFKFFSLLAVTATCFTPAVRELASTPTQVNMVTGDTVSVPLMGGGGGSQANSSDEQVAKVSANSDALVMTVTSDKPGRTEIDSKLFGFIPWKTHVHVVPTARVLVGGEAVGIRLESKGPIVVGYRHLSDGSSPAAKARVEIGDMIISVNHHPVHTALELQRAVREATTPLQLTVQRDRDKRDISLDCPKNTASNSQLGLYVRDRTVGVGTLTFYDPAHQAFGALGHVITDADTGQPIVGQGSLYPALITGIQAGKVGAPGEKRGTFSPQGKTIGEIGCNTPYGVFGEMPRQSFRQTTSSQLLPIALPEQVHVGAAKMYTVLHDQTVESFDVRIENTTRQSSPSTKSMIIRVTDPRLLAQSGGIVQGMSGSPLVQDGRLVGAVTHVFVSDPTRGYAVYAMWMLQQTKAFDATQDTWLGIPHLWPIKHAV